VRRGSPAHRPVGERLATVVDTVSCRGQYSTLVAHDHVDVYIAAGLHVPTSTLANRPPHRWVVAAHRPHLRLAASTERTTLVPDFVVTRMRIRRFVTATTVASTGIENP
jgi:hypothetical protein